MALGSMSLSQAQQHTLDSQPAARKKQRTSGAGTIDAAMSALFSEFEFADAHSGTIMKIELVNFMNHSHLVVDLKPGVNFVFGKNGSGKSALLAGCMVGLGCKAAAVKTTTKLSSFIQSGKQQATVKIWLYNGGSDRFQPDVYGPFIIIERLIDSKAGGKHVAQDCHGMVLLSRTAEIAEICEHFNIQVSNPCVVLTQEKARRFLSSTDDRVRYEFFMEATGLNVVKQNLLQIDSDIGMMEKQLKEFAGRLPAIESQVEQKKAAWEAATELQKIDGQIAAMLAKVAFVKAADAEKAAAEARHAVEAQAAEYDAALAKVQRSRELLDAAVRENAEAQSRLSSVGEEVERFASRISGLETQKKTLERERAKAKAKADAVEKEALRKRQAAREGLERAQREEAGRAARQEAEARRRDERRAALTAQVRELEGHIARSREEMDGLADEKVASQQRASEARRNEEELRRSLNGSRQALAQLSASSGLAQRAAPFGRDMPRLLQLIEQHAAKFSQPPVGPLGLHVSVSEHRWVHAVESALAPVLAAFVVPTHADRIALENIAKAARFDGGWQPQIVVARFDSQEYAIPAEKLPDRRRFKLMLDVVSFSHPMAQQVAIDRTGFERCILCASDAEAKRAVWGDPRAVAPNVARAFLETAFSLCMKGSTEIQEKPAQGSERRKTGLDAREQLERLTAEVAEKERALGAQQQAAAALLGASADYAKREQAITKAAKAARAQLEARRAELDALNSEGGLDEQTMQIAIAEAEAQEAEAAQLLHQSEQLRDSMRNVEQRLGPLGAQINELQEESAAMLARSAEDNDNAHAANIMLAKRKKGAETAAKALAEQERLRGGQSEQADSLERDARVLRERANAALAAGEEPPDVSGLSVGGVQQKAKRLMDKRKELLEARAAAAAAAAGGGGGGAGGGKRRGSRGPADGGGAGPSAPATLSDDEIAALEAAFRAASDELAEQKRLQANVATDMAALEVARKLRSKQWHKDRTQMGSVASEKFNYEMTKRQLAGSLAFEHHMEDAHSTLSITVQTNSQDKKSNQTQNVATLSGGERSFTTMAFQVALWNFVSVPFRCMDEFDVFMDDVFRRQAVTSLLESCDAQSSGQFLFLTPQDMSSMLDADSKPRHIFRMPDPRSD